jgi:hypothetical protein
MIKKYFERQIVTKPLLIKIKLRETLVNAGMGECPINLKKVARESSLRAMARRPTWLTKQTWWEAVADMWKGQGRDIL